MGDDPSNAKTGKQLSILVVHNRYQRRGGEDSVVNAEVELLQTMGMHVTTMVHDSRDPVQLRALVKRPDRLMFNDQAYAEARSNIRSQNIDLIHCHNLFPLLSTSVYAAALAENIPIVQTVHNYRMGCLNGLLLHNGKICERCRPGHHAPGVALGCYRGSHMQSLAFGITQTMNYRRGVWHQPTVYVAPGQLMRAKLMSWGIPEERIVFKPHFVPHDPGPRTAVGNYALFVGRLAPEKGVELLIDVWSNERLRLVIVGDGPLRAQLEQRVRDRGLRNVHFVGYQQREAVSTFLRHARFLVMPSLWLETFGMVVIEAYAHSVPVLATRLGTMADIVRDGTTGLLFARNSQHDLSDKLCELERDTARVMEMSRAARREYENLYSAESNAELLRVVYAQAFKQHEKNLFVPRTREARAQPP